MERYVIGDIHGRYDALLEVLELSKFDIEHDELIILGDETDGGRKTKEVIDLLIKIKNKVVILGNHTKWVINWAKTGQELPIWTHQGGYNTMESYKFNWENPDLQRHMKLYFSLASPYYVDNQKNLFVHGGFNSHYPIEQQHPDDLIWDRTLIKTARRKTIHTYTHIYVGHTTTQIYNSLEPLTFHNLTMLDTGAGWSGKLTIMNIETKKYWQSKLQNPRW